MRINSILVRKEVVWPPPHDSEFEDEYDNNPAYNNSQSSQVSFTFIT